jgi:hypothetical protein
VILRASQTDKLKLFKWDVETDEEENFDIDKAINDNWDKLDSHAQEIESKISNIKAEDIAFTDGETFQDKYNSGELKGEQGIPGTNGTDGINGVNGEDGFSPTITEKTNTDTEYILTVTNKDGSYDTPNLKGQDGAGGSGEGGTTNYTQLTNKPKINNIELSGNKTLSDLGITTYIEEQLVNKVDKAYVDNLVTGALEASY